MNSFVFAEFKKFKKQFPSGTINKEQFHEMAGSFLPPQQRTDEFIDRLFNAFDNDRSGEVDFQEFMLAMTMCSSDDPGSPPPFATFPSPFGANRSLQRISFASASAL